VEQSPVKSSASGSREKRKGEMVARETIHRFRPGFCCCRYSLKFGDPITVTILDQTMQVSASAVVASLQFRAGAARAALSARHIWIGQKYYTTKS
jgi:hypothetical protein